MNRTTFSSAALGQLRQVLKEAEQRETAGISLTRALIGERAIMLDLFDRHPSELRIGMAEVAQNSVQKPSSLTTWTIRLAVEHEFYESTVLELLAMRRAPLPGRLGADDFIADRQAQAETQRLKIGNLLFSHLARAEARELAWLRLAQTAVALERYRAANDKHLPDTLDELVPDFLLHAPEDPFDGQPLRYRPFLDGYLLYSIGPDLQDDNGDLKKDWAFPVGKTANGGK